MSETKVKLTKVQKELLRKLRSGEPWHNQPDYNVHFKDRTFKEAVLKALEGKGLIEWKDGFTIGGYHLTPLGAQINID